MNSKAQSVNIVINFQERIRNANYQQSRKDFTRYPSVPNNNQFASICANCGQQGPANGKKCKNYGITGNYANKCRKPKKSQPQTHKPPQTNVNQIETNATRSDDEESLNYIKSYQQLYKQVYDSNFDSDSDDYVAAISSDSANQLEALNAKIKYGNILAN